MGRELKVVLFLTAASIANSVLADPLVLGISGEPERGGIVVISGLDFGSNSSPEPLMWDDFEAGSNGAIVTGNSPRIGVPWSDEYTLPAQRPTYTDQNQRPNSNRSTFHPFSEELGWHSSITYINENLPKAYFSFWWRFDQASLKWSRNTKPMMVYGNLEDNKRPTLYVGLAFEDGPIRSNVLDTQPVDANTLWGDTTLPAVDEEWVRFEFWAELSTPGVADGTFQTWTHRPYSADPSIALELDSGENQYMTRASNGVWRSWRIGSFMSYLSSDDGPPDAPGNIQVDDVYFASTRARVEIGNASRWQDVTHREIQIARDWSDGSISFEMNQGGFESIAGTYVYVIDAQGRVNSIGLPLCDDCPNPPGDFVGRKL